MGFLTELLKDVPLSAVLKERFAIAEKEIETLKSENANFKQLDLQKDQEIQRLRQTIQELQKIHSLPQLNFIPPFYYADGDQTPYCPTCWEVNKIQVHLPPPSKTGIGPSYTCSNCNKSIIHPQDESGISRGMRA